jgi:DNA-binding response OmpR family regulator
VKSLKEQETILIVDDEWEIGELLKDFLEAEEYQVLLAQNGEECLSLFKNHSIDCILLDIMMPGQSGFEVCKKIRQISDVPILFLSALEKDIHIIRGLGIGGDDYIVKTASPGEIIARIKAVLRRLKRQSTTENNRHVYDFGQLKIDTLSREVILDGNKVMFTAKEFDLLRLLAEYPNQVFTREQLYEAVWGDCLEDLHAVRVYISRIREKIEKDPSHSKWIQTVWGVGYKFTGKRI